MTTYSTAFDDYFNLTLPRDEVIAFANEAFDNYKREVQARPLEFKRLINNLMDQIEYNCEQIGRANLRSCAEDAVALAIYGLYHKRLAEIEECTYKP